MANNELLNKIEALNEWEALLEEARAEAEAIKDEIKAYMGDSEELRAGEYKITWKNITSARIDTRALTKALPDIAAAFTRSTTTRRFVVA